MKRLLLIAALIAAPLAQADSDNVTLWTVSTFSSEATTCAAFYALAGAGGYNAGEHEFADEMASAATTSLMMAIEIIGEETAQAQYQLQMKVQKDEIDGKMAHFSRLLLKHGEKCKAFSDDPVAAYIAIHEEAVRRFGDK